MAGLLQAWAERVFITVWKMSARLSRQKPTWPSAPYHAGDKSG